MAITIKEIKKTMFEVVVDGEIIDYFDTLQEARNCEIKQLFHKAFSKMWDLQTNDERVNENEFFEWIIKPHNQNQLIQLFKEARILGKGDTELNGH